MIPRRGTFALALPALFSLGACSSVSVQQEAAPELAMLRSAGLRVVVAPFANRAPDDGFVAESLGPLGEVFALEASRERPMREQVAIAMHDDVVAWLQQSEFEVIDPWHAATRLAHAGLLGDAGDRSRAAAVAAATGADAVLYGEVRRWNRGYYVVQTAVEVTLHLELVHANAGRTLFRAERTETVGAGLTGGPTGYVSVVTEPIAGLRGSTLRQLSRSVTRHTVADLNGGVLAATAAGTGPRLSVVALAREHEGPFRAGERIDVIAVGSPDCTVRFDLGRLRTAVPMAAAPTAAIAAADPARERATYLGHYIVAAEEVAEELPLTCSIQRGASRRSVAVRYRWDGRVSIDGCRS